MQQPGEVTKPTGGREEGRLPLTKAKEDDAFFIYEFKVTPCDKHYVHDWSCCPYAHTNERARRRDPRSHAGLACPAMKQDGRCALGDACPFSHTSWEFWLHPTRFKTAMCSLGEGCSRKFCFFAHTISELRMPSGLSGWGAQRAGPAGGSSLPPPSGLAKVPAAQGTTAGSALGGSQHAQQRQQGASVGATWQGEGPLPNLSLPVAWPAGRQQAGVHAVPVSAPAPALLPFQVSAPSLGRRLVPVEPTRWSGSSSEGGAAAPAGVGAVDLVQVSAAGGANLPLPHLGPSGIEDLLRLQTSASAAAGWPLPTTQGAGLPLPHVSRPPPLAATMPLQPATASSLTSSLGPSTPRPPAAPQPSIFRESPAASLKIPSLSSDEGLSMAALLDALRDELATGTMDLSLASSLLASLLPPQQAQHAQQQGSAAWLAGGPAAVQAPAPAPALASLETVLQGGAAAAAGASGWHPPELAGAAGVAWSQELGWTPLGTVGAW